MSRTGWAIRLFPLEDKQKTEAYFSNSPLYGNRQEDTVIVFSGIYGVDDYLVWAIHPNLSDYDFSMYGLDVKLYMWDNPNLVLFQEYYRGVKGRFNPRTSKYDLYCISEDTITLGTTTSQFEGMHSLEYKEDRTPAQALKELLEENNIFTVCWHSFENEEKLLDLKSYDSLTFSSSDKIKDLIMFIADENDLEWTVKEGILHIGRELSVIQEFNSTRKIEPEYDKLVTFGPFKKYYGRTRPIEVLSHINELWKCVWVKHKAGRRGGETKACFTRRGHGKIDKEIYYTSLEGREERANSILPLLQKHFGWDEALQIGRVVLDSGDPIEVDSVSTEEDISVKQEQESEEKVILDGTEEGGEEKNPTQISNNTRWYPYLDYKAGIFFPAVPWKKGFGPNTLPIKKAFHSKAIDVGYIPGPEDKMIYCRKGWRDFRFNLMDNQNNDLGWTWYVDGQFGKMLIQSEGVPTEIPGVLFNKDKLDPNPHPEKDEDNMFPYPGSNNNPSGQQTSYIYMRPKITEASGQYSKISLNAGDLGDESKWDGTRIRLKSDTGTEIRTKSQRIEVQKLQVKLESADILPSIKEDDDEMGGLLEWEGHPSERTQIILYKNQITITKGSGSGIPDVKLWITEDNNFLVQLAGGRTMTFTDSGLDVT